MVAVDDSGEKEDNEESNYEDEQSEGPSAKEAALTRQLKSALAKLAIAEEENNELKRQIEMLLIEKDSARMDVELSDFPQTLNFSLSTTSSCDFTGMTPVGI